MSWASWESWLHYLILCLFLRPLGPRLPIRKVPLKKMTRLKNYPDEPERRAILRCCHHLSLHWPRRLPCRRWIRHHLPCQETSFSHCVWCLHPLKKIFIIFYHKKFHLPGIFLWPGLTCIKSCWHSRTLFVADGSMGRENNFCSDSAKCVAMQSVSKAEHSRSWSICLEFCRFKLFF